jgi:hypothetical protein
MLGGVPRGMRSAAAPPPRCPPPPPRRSPPPADPAPPLAPRRWRPAGGPVAGAQKGKEPLGHKPIAIKRFQQVSG